MTLSEPIKPGLQSWYFLLGRDAEATAMEQETREQLASEAFTLDSTDIDE